MRESFAGGGGYGALGKSSDGDELGVVLLRAIASLGSMFSLAALVCAGATGVGTSGTMVQGAFRSGALGEDLAWWANCLGVTGAPFDSYLTLRGIRTLFARVDVHLANTELVVRALDGHDAVGQVHYPGLPSHPGHEIARTQQTGFGAMVSFELHGGIGAVAAFTETLQHFSLAESLGGVESLVAHPATMTHSSMDAAARAEAGIKDSLVRLSVGIERGSDLVRDLERALNLAARASVMAKAV